MSSAQHWDERYAEKERLFIPDPDVSLAELSGTVPATTALDLGAGEGRNSLYLASKGWTVTAVDFSQVALDRLTGFALESKVAVQTLRVDLIQYLESSRDTFDLVVIANLHPSRPERLKLYSLAQRAVNPGGHLFLIGHHIDSLGIIGPPDPDRLLDESEVSVGFDQLEIQSLRVRLDPTDGSHAPAPSLVAWMKKPSP